MKLPIAFAFALVLLFSGGVFGISTLNHAVSTYRLDVLDHVDAKNKAAGIAGQFSVAIQEWKNVLLRGTNPKDLDTYWSAHQKELAKVIQGIDALSLEMDDETSKGIAAKLGVSKREAMKPLVKPTRPATLTSRPATKQQEEKTVKPLHCFWNFASTSLKKKRSPPRRPALWQRVGAHWPMAS